MTEGGRGEGCGGGGEGGEACNCNNMENVILNESFNRGFI